HSGVRSARLARGPVRNRVEPLSCQTQNSYQTELLPNPEFQRRATMKWVTRERARVDRIACPWLITRFVDPDPKFLFVPVAQVLETAKRESAIPYDIPSVELGHHGPQCSFDAFIDRFELDDPALSKLAPIV